MASKKPRSIYSVYLTEAEESVVREIAEINGTSVNFVVRAAVRTLAGLPTPRLVTPAEDESATSSR